MLTGNRYLPLQSVYAEVSGVSLCYS